MAADGEMVFFYGNYYTGNPPTLGTQSTFSAPVTSPALDFIVAPGTPRSGMTARIHNITDIASTASAQYQFMVVLSSDSVAWNVTAGVYPPVPFTVGSVQSTRNEVTIPFIMGTGIEYARLSMVMPAGSSGSPLISFASEIEWAWPG